MLGFRSGLQYQTIIQTHYVYYKHLNKILSFLYLNLAHVRFVPDLVLIEGPVPVFYRIGFGSRISPTGSGSRRSPTGSEPLRWRRGVEACASGEYITVTSLLYKISHPAHSQPGLRIRMGSFRIRIQPWKSPDPAFVITRNRSLPNFYLIKYILIL